MEYCIDEIKRYMEENGIQHRRITPLWPQANSEVENFMNPLTKVVRSAHVEGKTWKHLHCLTIREPLTVLLDLLQHSYCSIDGFETNFHNLLAIAK